MTPTLPGGSEPVQVSVVQMTVSVFLPLSLAIYAHRKLGVGWRYFGFGAIVGLGLQVLYLALLAPGVPTTFPELSWLGLSGGTILITIYIGLAAGVVGEGLRYAGYRWLLARGEKTWEKAVMYGLGYSGPIALWPLLPLAVALNAHATKVGYSGPIALWLLLPPVVLAERSDRPLRWVLFGDPAWRTWLPAWCCGWTPIVDVALAVLVLQVFRRGSIRWLALAMPAHALWVAAPSIVRSLVAPRGGRSTLACHWPMPSPCSPWASWACWRSGSSAFCVTRRRSQTCMPREVRRS